MAFKRSAVRSRYSPPKNKGLFSHQKTSLCSLFGISTSNAIYSYFPIGAFVKSAPFFIGEMRLTVRFATTFGHLFKSVISCTADKTSLTEVKRSALFGFVPLSQKFLT